MKIFNRTKGDGELFEFDDELRKKLNDMSNTDELIDVMDTVGDHRDAIIDAVETLDVLQESGVFDLLKRLGMVSQDELEQPPKIGPLSAAKQLRDPAVQRGLGTLILFLKALGTPQNENEA